MGERTYKGVPPKCHFAALASNGNAYSKCGPSLLALAFSVAHGLFWVATVPLPWCLATASGPLLGFLAGGAAIAATASSI